MENLEVTRADRLRKLADQRITLMEENFNSANWDPEAKKHWAEATYYLLKAAQLEEEHGR